MTAKTNKKNCLLIYGGGLCDCANVFMREYAEFLHNTDIFKKTFVGFYSFAALLEKDCYVKEWGKELKEEAELGYGGFFGTCRKIELTDPVLQEKAISNCKQLGISWVFVAGGDGSSRQTAEIADAFAAEGIKCAFVMPCTIDGITGGKSIGMRQAVEVSLKVIEQLSATCLQTLEEQEFPVLIVELQGRNRDDILANVVNRVWGRVSRSCLFWFAEPQIFAVPANYDWDLKALTIAVNMSKNPTLILLSEGATIKRSELKNRIARKCRTFEVAHLSQMNGLTNVYDKELIRSYIDRAAELWEEAIVNGKPFTIVYDEKTAKPRVEAIDYFAKLNPRDEQKTMLSPELEAVIKEYIAW